MNQADNFENLNIGSVMRRHMINQLNLKERQWLLKAIIKMVLADTPIVKEEIEELKESILLYAGKEVKNFKEFLSRPEIRLPLRPLSNASYDDAFNILIELARIAAIDCRFVEEEEALLKEILSLLDFDDKAIEKVVNWTKRLAVINDEEQKLKQELKAHFQGIQQQVLVTKS
ncbi:MAG: hypothetical protein ABIK68_13670 [bacterium]